MGYYRRTHGLPCSHEIYNILLQMRKLRLSDFHQHWHITSTSLFKSESDLSQPTSNLEVVMTSALAEWMDLPQVQQDRLAKSLIEFTSTQLVTQPSVLRDPQPLIKHKGRPTAAETRSQKLLASTMATEDSLSSASGKLQEPGPMAKKIRMCRYIQKASRP